MLKKRASSAHISNGSGFPFAVGTDNKNDIETDEQYDRVVSIEMFEHMRNWKELFSRISRWLKNDGKFFMHIFTTEGLPWLYDADSDADWMAVQNGQE